MQHRAKYHQTTIWCTKSVSFVPADCSGRSRQSGGFGVSKRRRRPGGSSGSVVSSGRRRCGERNGAGRPTGPWTCPSPDPSDAFYSRYHPSHWWRSTKTWLSSAARGASSSRSSWLSALFSKRALNLVRGPSAPGRTSRGFFSRSLVPPEQWRGSGGSDHGSGGDDDGVRWPNQLCFLN